VTIRNVTSRHLPLRLGQAEDVNSILIQLLRHAGFAEEEYPYQSYYANHGWGPKHEGLGILLVRRYKNGEVPGSEVLYQLATDTESKLLADARRYTPFAHYFASPAGRPDLSVIEVRIASAERVNADHNAAVSDLRRAAQDNRTGIGHLAERIATIVEEVAELRGNVGELINIQPASSDLG
jgi:hypothetical protein